MKTDVIGILRQTTFLAGLPDEALQRLASAGSLLDVEKRGVLFREDEEARGCFVLLTGAVRLFKTDPDGNDVTIRTIKPGDVFAEVVLFEEPRYPVTAEAVAASQVFSLPRREFRRCLDDPGFQDAFIATLMRKQRYLAERVRYLTSYDAEQRFLLFLREQYGRQARVHPHISKRDMAAAIGTTPETLSRLIQRLSGEKLIVWQGRTITVSDAAWATVADL